MMKKLVASALVLLSPMATAGPFYVDANIGGSKVKVSESYKFTGYGGIGGRFQLQNGNKLGVNFGYEFNPFRVEFAYSFLRNKIDRMDIPAGTIVTDGRTRLSNLMLNFFYDYHYNNRYSTYVGAGAGLSYIKLAPLNYKAQHDDAFAYQFILGGSMRLDDQFAITADYRYLKTQEEAFQITTLYRMNYSLRHHILTLGLRYNF